MIEISNLHKTFNAGKLNEVKALQGIDLEIKAGEFLVVVGSNGSGKSTFLNSIAGTILPSSGRIVLADHDVTNLKEFQRSKWIARVFQNPLTGTAPDLSILENFRLAALRTSSKNLRIGINEDFRKLVQEKVAMLQMGLEDKLMQPMGTLSGGQRQALTLLMTVMDDLKILLLDEPTAALDPRSAETVMKIADQLIHEYQLTAVLVTHNMKEASNYGSRIIQLVEGKVLRDVLKESSALKPSDLYEWFS